jgi:hypothetical protein
VQARAPERESQTICFQPDARSASSADERTAKGISTTTATLQRMNVSAIGETWPTIARPTIQLNAQMR